MTQSDRGGLVMGGFLDGFPSYTREGQWYRLEDVVQTARGAVAADRRRSRYCGTGPAPTT